MEGSFVSKHPKIEPDEYMYTYSIPLGVLFLSRAMDVLGVTPMSTPQAQGGAYIRVTLHLCSALLWGGWMDGCIYIIYGHNKRIEYIRLSIHLPT